MRSQALGAAVALTLLSSDVVAAARFPRAIKGKGFLKVPVGTVDRPKKEKRDGNAIETTLDNMDYFYATEIEFGSPPQSVTVLVDTGSSELWVNPDCSTAPTIYQAQQCDEFGSYNPDDSDTPPFGPFGRSQINYGDVSDPSTHSSVNLRYYRDTLTLGDAQITNQTFGVVTSSEGQSQGIFGLSPDLDGGFEGDQPYSLLLHTMQQQGVIETRSFALDLRHADAKTGSLIYGGIDRNKFIGSLENMPIIRGIEGEYRLAVELDSMGVTVDGQSRGYTLEEDDRNVMLDSGTTLSRLHYSAALPILQSLGAEDDGEGYYYVPCDMRNSGGSIDFGFGNKTVQVPLKDFILPSTSGSSILSYYCTVGVVITTHQQILGDTVLRAGYFVFDWDNESVYIAQAANCGDEDIVAIEKGEDPLADVTGKCKKSDALFTGSGSGSSTDTASQTSHSELPTGTHTTTFTITSCPPFAEDGCQTGVVTTRTITGAGNAKVTSDSGDGDGGETGTSNGGNSTSNGDSDGNDDNDDAASHSMSLSLMLVSMGALVGGLWTIL